MLKRLLLLSVLIALIGLAYLFSLHGTASIHFLKQPKYERAEIYIQAGHEGRVRGSTGTASSYGREIDWTPIVADEATRILREAGISVLRCDADDRRFCVVDLALSIHFDGNDHACSTGASIGYDDPTDQPAAKAWKAYYSNFFQFDWKPDNFTANLKYYYNYKYTLTKDAELVLEMGDLTCPKQARWLKSNLKNLGHIVAYFAAKRIGKEHLLEVPDIA